MSSASEAPVSRGAKFVSTSIDHPHLLRLDAESIRVFIRKYDAYCKELTARAAQLTGYGVTTEPVRPVNITFCVDSEQLESALDLWFIEGADDYDGLSETQLAVACSA